MLGLYHISINALLRDDEILPKKSLIYQSFFWHGNCINLLKRASPRSETWHGVTGFSGEGSLKDKLNDGVNPLIKDQGIFLFQQQFYQPSIRTRLPHRIWVSGCLKRYSRHS